MTRDWSVITGRGGATKWEGGGGDMIEVLLLRKGGGGEKSFTFSHAEGGGGGGAREKFPLLNPFLTVLLKIDHI